MNGNITNVGMAVQLFNNPEFGNIRILIIEDAPWFVGRDVAVALGTALPEKRFMTMLMMKIKGGSKSEHPLDSRK